MCICACQSICRICMQKCDDVVVERVHIIVCHTIACMRTMKSSRNLVFVLMILNSKTKIKYAILSFHSDFNLVNRSLAFINFSYSVATQMFYLKFKKAFNTFSTWFLKTHKWPLMVSLSLFLSICLSLQVTWFEQVN